jgi:hypothetical protein
VLNVDAPWRHRADAEMRICIAQRAARAYPAAFFISQRSSEVQVRRLVSVLGVVSILLGAAAAPVGAAAPDPSNQAGPPGRILGVVPVLEQGKAGRPSGGGNLIYHYSSGVGGPVMQTGNRTYAIFWAGSGTPDWGDAGYIPTIQGYFANVAADSGKTSNVYATDTQYYGPSGAKIAYASMAADSTTDTYPYPAANGCTDKATTICLSDGQLRTELTRVMTANSWPASSAGVQNLFFIFTPKGVGSCAGSSCAYTNYCAYHSWIPGADPILYANQPYAAQNYRIYTCDSGQHPNGTTADATLNVVSHEHNEAITDEQGSAWYDSQGAENGDKCAWNFGTALGSTSTGQYNQVIGTGTYYLQQEWSNASSGCVRTYK